MRSPTETSALSSALVGNHWGVFVWLFPPPFLLQFFISPHCILQFLIVESVIKLGVNVA